MKLNLQARYSLVIVSLIIAIVLILAATLLFQFKSSTDALTAASSEAMSADLLDQMKKRGEVTIRFLAENLVNALYHYDMLAIHQLLATTKTQEDVLYTYVYDQDGKILHDGIVTIPEFGLPLDDEASKQAIGHQGKLLIQEDGNVLGVSLPIWIGDGPLGGAKIGLSLKSNRRDIVRMRERLEAIEQLGLRRNMVSLTITTLLLIGVGVFMSLVIANRLIRPIRQLAAYAGQVGRGNYDVRLSSNRQDEIGYLIAAFNQMSFDLQRTTVSKEYFESIINNMSDMLAVLTPEGLIRMTNRSLCDLMDCEQEALMGRSFESLFPPESAPMMKNWLQELIQKGSIAHKDTAYVTRDGRLIPISLSGAIIYQEENGIKGVVAVAQDCTERRQMEEALRKSHSELAATVQERTLELTRSNEQLRDEIKERQNAEALIKASLQEKEVLLREIYHRVKNNMQVISSLLKLQSRYVVDDPHMLEVFTECQSRIKSISLVHEKLYESKNLAKIDFKGYVHKLTRSLFEVYRAVSARVKMTTEVEAVSLGIDTAIPCGLIINELVSNSLKHAFPEDKQGAVRIALQAKAEDKIVLIVSDNGVGLPQDVDYRNTDSLGLQLVVSLAENQLGGTVELDRTEGTIFRISFKGGNHGESKDPDR